MFALIVDCRLIACVSYFHAHRLEVYLSPTPGRHSLGQRRFILHARTVTSYREMPRLRAFLDTATFRTHYWISFQHSQNRSVYAALEKLGCHREDARCMLNFYCATRMHSAYMPWQVVCPSVCHTPVLCLNRYRYPQSFFTIGQPHNSSFFHTKRGGDIPTATPPNGGVECKGYDKMTIFSQISRSISETVIVRWAHAARQLSIDFSFHPYNIQRDCPRGVARGNKNVVEIAIFGLTH